MRAQVDSRVQIASQALPPSGLTVCSYMYIYTYVREERENTGRVHHIYSPAAQAPSTWLLYFLLSFRLFLERTMYRVDAILSSLGVEDREVNSSVKINFVISHLIISGLSYSSLTYC